MIFITAGGYTSGAQQLRMGRHSRQLAVHAYPYPVQDILNLCPDLYMTEDIIPLVPLVRLFALTYIRGMVRPL